MKVLTVQPIDLDQETAICMFLDALHVQYKTDNDVDDTTYLNSSPAMIEHISTAIKQELEGKGISISLNDIWK